MGKFLLERGKQNKPAPIGGGAIRKKISAGFILKRKALGFTLLEVLLVVTAISILASIAVLAINPARQLKKSRDAQRSADIQTIANAVYQYAVDSGDIPVSIGSTMQILGTDTSGCNVNCGGVAGDIETIDDDTQAEFDAGTYTGTSYYVGTSAVGLNLPQTSGTYTSSVHDSGVVADWGTLSWTPNRPMNKELPDNGQSETAYAEGNASLSGNVLLMHMNDGVSGTGQTVADTSGHNDHGITTGNPNLSATGKFNQACDLPAGTNYITIDNLDVNTAAGAHNTVEFWMYWRGTSGQMPFGWNQAYDLWITGACFGFNTGEGNVFGTSNAGLANGWHHVAAVFYNGVPSAGTVKLYVDGQERALSACQGSTTGSRSVTSRAQISGWAIGAGYYFNGLIDELAIFNRELSATEVEDHYRRGALRLIFDVRSCDDAACAGETFDGGYSEADNGSLGLPSVSVDAGNNRYFQYRATLQTDDATISPEFSLVSAEYMGSTGGELTASSCLDLSSSLVSEYITDIPYDPLGGTPEKTMYAIRRTPGGRIFVKACDAEYESEISLSR